MNRVQQNARASRLRLAPLCLCLALLVPTPSAHAGWLRDEWRNFRSYPRLTQAHRLYQQQRYDEARALVEQVERFDPDNRGASLLHFHICEQQRDLACITRLGTSWQAHAPGDALGPAMLAYVAYVEGRDADLARLAAIALDRPGLSADTRSTAGRVWVNALLRLQRFDAAAAAMKWLDTHRVHIAPGDRGAWMARLGKPTPKQAATPVAVADRKMPTSPINASSVTTAQDATIAAANPPDSSTSDSAAMHPPATDATTAASASSIEPVVSITTGDTITDAPAVPAEAAATPATATTAVETPPPASNLPAAASPTRAPAKPTPPSQPATRARASVKPARVPAPSRPIARAVEPPPLPSPAATLPTSAEVLQLIEQGRHTEAIAKLQAIEAAGQLSVEAREGLVLTLQGRDCASVLELVPEDAAAPLTSARQQMAAGYCSVDDVPRAARHFAAASALAGDDAALAAQALAAQAHSLEKLGNNDEAAVAIAQASRLAPGDAHIQAAYGYFLKSRGQQQAALQQFQIALQLDGDRVELLPEIALLQQRLNQPQESILYGRKAIDQGELIRQRTGQSEDDALRQQFGWRRAVQSQEDRFGWSVNSNVRLDDAPDTSEALSPLDYSQYGGTFNSDLSWRYTPLGALRPTWLIARGAVELQDPGIRPQWDNKLLGIGVRQRLMKHHAVFGSVEYFYRSTASRSNDVMLRLSGSHSRGTDWQPVDDSWRYLNLFADLAWMVREQAYFATLSGEWGRRYRLQRWPFKAALTPYLASAFVSDNGGEGKVRVSRFDVGLGLALRTWHGGDAHRAPAYTQRIALEVRQVIGGNTTETNTVQLRWIVQHL